MTWSWNLWHHLEKNIHTKLLATKPNVGLTLRPMKARIPVDMRPIHTASILMSSWAGQDAWAMSIPWSTRSDTLVNSSSQTTTKATLTPTCQPTMWKLLLPLTSFSLATIWNTNLTILVKNALLWPTVWQIPTSTTSSPTCWKLPSNAKSTPWSKKVGPSALANSTASWRKSWPNSGETLMKSMTMQL